MTSSITDLQAAAAAYMPQEVLAKWSTLFRPAARLSAAADLQHVVGQLGGEPVLPADMEWPTWQGHGPLSFLASVDCARLPHEHLDLSLPAAGTLLFFYFDGQVDDGDEYVSWREPETLAGARVIFVPSDVPAVERQTPSGLAASPRHDLSCELVTTAPLREHPALYKTMLDDGMSLAEWAGPEELFNDAYADAAAPRAEIQIGGIAYPIQDAVENDAALATLGEPAEWGDAAVQDEADRWVLLAQFAPTERSGMRWRYADALYWLISRGDLAAGRFDKAFFTSQT